MEEMHQIVVVSREGTVVTSVQGWHGIPVGGGCVVGVGGAPPKAPTHISPMSPREQAVKYQLDLNGEGAPTTLDVDRCSACEPPRARMLVASPVIGQCCHLPSVTTSSSSSRDLDCSIRVCDIYGPGNSSAAAL